MERFLPLFYFIRSANGMFSSAMLVSPKAVTKAGVERLSGFYVWDFGDPNMAA